MWARHQVAPGCTTLQDMARHIPDTIDLGLSQNDAAHLIDEISRTPLQGR
jgi:hypothetical protein